MNRKPLKFHRGREAGSTVRGNHGEPGLGGFEGRVFLWVMMEKQRQKGMRALGVRSSEGKELDRWQPGAV